MKIIDIIIWILFIISLAVAGWYLFGSSPTLEEAILVFILTLLVIGLTDIREIKVRQRMFEKSFINLARDFKEYKDKKK